MKNRYLLLLPVILIGLFIGYKYGFKKATKTTEGYKKEIKINNEDKKEILSICPFYTVNGGSWSCNTKTVLIEEVDKSQLIGRVLIIDKGKVVFYSLPRKKISIDPVRTYDYGDAFVISYFTDVDSDTAIMRDFYKNSDGEYKLVKKINTKTQRITYYAKVEEINEMVAIFYLNDPDDQYSWNSQFYASPVSKYGNDDSKKWSDLVNKNLNSVFKITGVHLENDCNDYNLKLCYENLYIEDIEIVNN